MLDDLIEGYRRFRTEDVARRPDFYQDLAQQGQAPEALIVGCSDSRVDPATILRADAGQLFVVRNVANLVPPWSPDGDYHGTSAALEFGVHQLQVRHIIVLGHAGCGGAQALLHGADRGEMPTEFIGPWLRIAAEMRDRLCANGRPTPQELEQALVRLSLKNLMTFPWIAERVEQGKLSLHGWYYDIANGALMARDPATDRFVPL